MWLASKLLEILVDAISFLMRKNHFNEEFLLKSPLRLKLHYLANTNIWNIKYEEEINEIEEKQILTSSRAYFTISACYLLSNKIEKTFWAVQVSLPNWQPTTAHLAWRIDVGLISQQLPHDLRMTFLRSYP